MRTAQELFEELNDGDEGVRIEAKRASEVGKSIMETICAFANEPDLDGGYLLLGAVRKGFDENGFPSMSRKTLQIQTRFKPTLPTNVHRCSMCVFVLKLKQRLLTVKQLLW